MEMQRQIWKRAGAGLTAALVLAAGFLLGNGQVNAQTTPQQALQELQLEDAAAILTDGPDSYSKQGNKALVLHDRLLDVVYPAQTGSTAYDALVSGGADSTGYAQAMALLLEEVGLENSLVTDPATGESWNRVRIDGSWYNLSVYRDDLSGRRTAFLKSDSAFADLLGSDPSSWEGENPCTSTYYDNWFLNQSQDGGDVWKNDLYYTNGSGTLYAGYLMGTATHSGLYREETGLDFVDACAAFDGSLYLIGSLNSRQGLYLYEGSSSVEIGLDGTLVHRGSVTPVEQDIGTDPIVSMYSNSTGLVLVTQDGSEKEITLHTHTLGDWQTVQKMDCAGVIPGKEVRICTDCGEVVEIRYQSPEHSYSDWTVAQNPSLEQEGRLEQVCANCGDRVTKPLLYGDVNLDGSVTVLDVMRLAQSVVGSIQLPQGLDGNYDRSEDGAIGVLDVMALAQYIVSGQRV